MGEIIRVAPRILVVNGICPDGLDLLLLSREGSTAVLPTAVDEVLRYAREHAVEEIAPGIRHKRQHILQGGKEYHIGSVIKEEEAFAGGYHLPHIETFCANIALITMQFGVELFNESRTAFLREQNRLKGKQDLFVLSPSDKPYIVIEIATVEKSGDLPPNLGKSKVDLDHPVRLYLHSQSSDGLIPVEFQYHAHGVQGPRHLYHYVTYIKPVRK